MVIYKGWNAKLMLESPPGSTQQEVGVVESVTVDITAATEGYYELGDAKPVEIVPGNVEISGTVDRAWIDSDLLDLIDAAPAISEFGLSISIEDTNQILNVISAKPESASFDVPQDGFIMHSFDFIARDFEITEE